MTTSQLFSIIGLSFGIIGLVLIIYPVLYRMVREVIIPTTTNRLVSIMLPIAKITYLVLMIPVLIYSLIFAVQMPSDNTSLNIIRGLYGFGVFMHGVSWVLIYTRLAEIAWKYLNHDERSKSEQKE